MAIPISNRKIIGSQPGHQSSFPSGIGPFMEQKMGAAEEKFQAIVLSHLENLTNEIAGIKNSQEKFEAGLQELRDQIVRIKNEP